jgi:hypothetical protein
LETATQHALHEMKTPFLRRPNIGLPGNHN